MEVRICQRGKVGAVEEQKDQYVYDIYVHEKHQEVLAVVKISHFQGDKCMGTTKKICRNLERLPLTPELLYYELTNGFPTFEAFDSKDFGGYTYNEILDQIEISDLSFDLWKIAEYDVGVDYGNIDFYFDHMNAKTRKLFEDTMRIIMKKTEFFPAGHSHRRGVSW